MKYVRKYLQEAEVIERTEDDDERSGVVKYINEFGSICVMLTKHFDTLYQPKEQ